jgi:hypothetical protein
MVLSSIGYVAAAQNIMTVKPIFNRLLGTGVANLPGGHILR